MANVGYATLQVIPSMKGAQAALTSGIAGPSQAAGQAAGIGFGSRFAAALKSPAGIVTAAVGAAAIAGKALYDVGEQFDSAYDTIRVGTGATGTDLEKLKTVFKGVVSDVPTDFASASQAVADLNTRLGLTGPELRERSAQFLELSRITGTDLGENIESVTRLFGDWSIATEDQGSTLDKLFRVSQATGIGVSDLSRLMVQFGSPLRQLGIDFDDAAAMFAKFEKEGVNIQTLMPGLRFALKTFGKAGREPADALRETFAEIQRLGPGAESLALGFEVFGQRAGPDMVAAILEGRFALDDILGVMNNGKDTIRGAARDTEDFGEKWTRLKNRVLVALEPIASRVFAGVGKAMDLVGPHIEKLLAAATQLLSGHGSLAKKLRPVWNGIRSTISGVVDFVRELWAQWGDDITAFYETYFEAFIQKLQAGFEIVKGIFDVFAGILSGDWSRVWDGLKGIFGGIWDTIVGTIRQGWAQIVLIFSTVGERLLSAGESAITALWDGMKAAWNFIATWAPTLPGRILGWLASLGGRLLALGGQAFNLWWTGMRTIFTAVAAWLAALPGRIVGFLASLPGRMLSAGANAIRALWNGFQSLVLWIGGKVAGFADGIVNAIGNIITGAYNAGKNIVQGLWNGWASLVDWIIEKAKNFAGSVIDAVLSTFGIGSPSKVFAEMGRNLARGLAAGWDDEAPGVFDGIEKQAAAVTIAPHSDDAPTDPDDPRFGGGRGPGPGAGLYIDKAYFGDRDVLPDLDYFSRTQGAVG